MRKLTVIIPNKDRLMPNSISTEFLFRSLDNQSFRDFDVLIVDGGSKNYEELKNYIGMLDKGIKKTIIQNKLSVIWNKCILNNFGIKRCDSEYAMTTDADMLFGKEFIANLCKSLSENTFVESVTMYMKYGIMKHIYAGSPDFFKDENKCKIGRVKRRTTCGGCQATSIKNWEKLKGYDEEMKGWGFEDQELLFRAELSGLKIVWLGEQGDVCLFHQAHDKPNDKENTLHTNDNKNRLDNLIKTKKFDYVNKNGWGAG